MFGLFAKYRPNNSVQINNNNKKSKLRANSSNAYIYLIFSVLSAQAAQLVHCLVKLWQLRLILLIWRSIAERCRQNNFSLHTVEKCIVSLFRPLHYLSTTQHTSVFSKERVLIMHAVFDPGFHKVKMHFIIHSSLPVRMTPGLEWTGRMWAAVNQS